MEHRVAIQQEREKSAHDKHASPRSFVVGQRVLLRNWRGGGPRWVQGTIVRVLGAVQYEVDVGEREVRRCHADHLLPVNGEAAAGTNLREADTSQGGSVGTDDQEYPDHDDFSMEPDQQGPPEIPPDDPPDDPTSASEPESGTEPPPRYPRRLRVPRVPFDPSFS